MTWRDVDEGPSDEDMARFDRADDDYDDGMFPDERGLNQPARLRWHSARIAVIAGFLIIIFLIFLLA